MFARLGRPMRKHGAEYRNGRSGWWVVVVEELVEVGWWWGG